MVKKLHVVVDDHTNRVSQWVSQPGYPTMHYLGTRIHSQSMIAYKTLSISGNSCEILRSGNVFNMPNSYVEISATNSYLFERNLLLS